MEAKNAPISIMVEINGFGEIEAYLRNLTLLGIVKEESTQEYINNFSSSLQIVSVINTLIYV